MKIEFSTLEIAEIYEAVLGKIIEIRKIVRNMESYDYKTPDRFYESLQLLKDIRDKLEKAEPRLLLED